MHRSPSPSVDWQLVDRQLVDRQLVDRRFSLSDRSHSWFHPPLTSILQTYFVLRRFDGVSFNAGCGCVDVLCVV